jgi:hypothetical protein
MISAQLSFRPLVLFGVYQNNMFNSISNQHASFDIKVTCFIFGYLNMLFVSWLTKAITKLNLFKFHFHVIKAIKSS